MPTETVYGLAADAENPAAIAKIYAAKQRPAGHPLIVHIAPGADLHYWAASVPDVAQRLANAFWPGPLTLILPRSTRVLDAVTGGQPTVGLRCPSHPVARDLLGRFAAGQPGGQGGLAAPSANLFGQVSPTRASHVRKEFPELVDHGLLILDGGPSDVGIESTIVDVSMPEGATPTLLRPGHITAAAIEAVLGMALATPQKSSPQVSGSLKAHYAPRTPLSVVPRSNLASRLAAESEKGMRVAVVLLEPTANDWSELADQILLGGTDPIRYARELYRLLRDLDNQHHDLLLFEQPPQTAAWEAVNDRLRRAAATFISQRHLDNS